MNTLQEKYLRAIEILERASDPSDKEAEVLRCFPVHYFENLRAFVKECEDAGIKNLRSVN